MPYSLPSEPSTQQIRDALVNHTRLNEQQHHENQEKIDCIMSELKTFRLQYEDMLKEMKIAKLRAEQIRIAVLEKSVAGLIWAVIVFLGLAAWNYIKGSMR